MDTTSIIIGSIISTSLGTSSQCKGKKLLILSDIRDILGETDETTLTIKLRDDSTTKTFLFAEAVAENGGLVMYEITINLQ